jgi:hypothetical protein
MDRSGGRGMDKSDGSANGIGDGSKRRGNPRSNKAMDAVTEEDFAPDRKVQASSSLKVDRKLDGSFPDVAESKMNLHETFHSDLGGDRERRKSSMKESISVRAKNLMKGGTRVEKTSLLANVDNDN